MTDAQCITSAQELPGYRITRNLGVVRGMIVRSPSIAGNVGASLQTLFGGNITIYTELRGKARDDAHRLMSSMPASSALTCSPACVTTPLILPPASPTY